jgi:heat shock protein HtpX
MERRPYERDLGLSLRMAVALVLLACLYLPFLLWFVGWAYFLSGAAAALLVGVIALALLAAAPYLSERLTLSLAHAEPGTASARRRLEPMLERLCGLADLPPPRVAVMPTPVPNAFSAGRSPRNAVVVVTQGLLDRLDDEEIEAVLAHELSHIATRDAFVMTVAAAPALLGRKLVWGFVTLPATTSSTAGKVVFVFLLLYLLPIVVLGWIVYAFATLLVMSISRYRELVADCGAAVLTGAPEQLMSALQKIAGKTPLIPNEDLRRASTMNAFFVLPAEPNPGRFELDPVRIFPTHPPLAKRLERLQKLGRSVGRARGLPPRPDPIRPTEAREAPRNPQALAAFFIGVAVWGMLAGFVVTEADATSDTLTPLGLLGTLALLAGIVLGLQGVGRASGGAGGMGYAVAGLVLLVGPWVLGFLALAVMMILAAFGAGPFGV